MAKIDQLLHIVRDAHASDLHLAAGSVPVVRVAGKLEKTSHKILTPDTVKALLYEILTDDQIRTFERQGDLDVAYTIPDGARFRINIFRIQHGPAAAIRLIPDQPPSLESLGFADTVARLAEQRSGLILVTGPTNSGKTTTLAAMIDHNNTNFSRHILTLEDPIEYIHENKNSLVSQRQVGLHVASSAAGIRAALREDPDVLAVGDLRDTETITQALAAAETGLLVLGTLHTTSAAATIDRLLKVFPDDRKQQMRVMLADTLLGVISQHLLTKANGAGRVLAYELLTGSPAVEDLILEDAAHQLPMVIQSGRHLGMRLLDNHLKALVDAGIIRPEEAVRVAADPTPFLTKAEQIQETVKTS